MTEILVSWFRLGPILELLSQANIYLSARAICGCIRQGVELFHYTTKKRLVFILICVLSGFMFNRSLMLMAKS
jgi:hypothetical protein